MTTLSEFMQQRAEALHVARGVLKSSGGMVTGSTLPADVGVVELVDLAEYVVNGRHPLAGYGEES